MKNPLFLLLLLVLSIGALWFLQSTPLNIFSRASSKTDAGVRKEVRSCGEPCGISQDVLGVCKAGLLCDSSIGVCIPDPDNGGIVGDYKYGCTSG